MPSFFSAIVSLCLLPISLTPQAGKHYVCPPCPVDCHNVVYDKPGRCPRCEMTLVEQDAKRNVAILVWDGVELLDFAGPAEVFAATRVAGKPVFNVFTVGLKAGPITSQGFLKIEPNYSIDDCPAPNILVIPGGNTNPVTGNKAVMAWIKKTSMKSDMMLSVCTGAFCLAQAGLLDDLEATTWHGAIDQLRQAAPKVKVRDDIRYADSGDIITSAGVSAGIDGALFAVTKLSGPDVARATAWYMEYEWRPMVPRGARETELARRIKADPDGVIHDLELDLKAGVREGSSLLSDGNYFGLHENSKFRELIRKATQWPKAALVPKDEPGEPLVVTGRVLDEKNEPVSTALIYVYHTGKDGKYSSTGGNTASMGDSLNPRIFGYLRTGADGRYEYRTIRPGQYPGSGPPAHVHYEVSGRGLEKLVTELMFEGDSRMNRSNRREFERAGFTITTATRDDEGVWRCECDLKVKRESDSRR